METSIVNKDYRDEDVVTERNSVVLSHGHVLTNPAGRERTGHNTEERFSDDGSRSNIETKGPESTAVIDGSPPVAKPLLEVESKEAKVRLHTDHEPPLSKAAVVCDEKSAVVGDSVDDAILENKEKYELEH